MTVWLRSKSMAPGIHQDLLHLCLLPGCSFGRFDVCSICSRYFAGVSSCSITVIWHVSAVDSHVSVQQYLDWSSMCCISDYACTLPNQYAWCNLTGREHTDTINPKTSLKLHTANKILVRDQNGMHACQHRCISLIRIVHDQYPEPLLTGKHMKEHHYRSLAMTI